MTKKDSVQPRTRHITNLPVLAAIRLTEVQPEHPAAPRPIIERSETDYLNFMDSLDVGMVSIRNRDGALIGSSSDVIAELRAARVNGETISVEEATARAIKTLTA